MAVAVFKKIRGIIGNLFTLGTDEATANSLKNHVDGVEFTNYDGTVRKNAVVERPQGANQNAHASTYLDLKERAIDLEFYFDGSSPPAPGTNTGKYGICHTAGGIYSAGQIYLDTGSALTAAPMYQMMLAIPRDTFSGTVGMNQDDIYISRNPTTPFGWTMVGGEAHEIGEPSSIRIPFSYTDIGTPKSSTTPIPAGAYVYFSRTVVTTPFSGGSSPTLLAEVDGASGDTVLQSTSDNNIKKAGEYHNEETIEITAGYNGPARLTLGGTATAGAGYFIVLWATPGN